MSDYGTLTDYDMNTIRVYHSSLATDSALRISIEPHERNKDYPKGNGHLTTKDTKVLIAILEKAIHHLEEEDR